MYGILFAFQFLTIVPIPFRKSPGKGDLAKSTLYFPLVGLTLGALLAGLNEAAHALSVDPLFSAVLLVVGLVIVTGGLHMDGLADLSDALGCLGDRERCLEVMRDSRTGAMGVLAIVSVFLLKLSALAALSDSARTPALILMCLLSRFILTFMLGLFPYARQEGTGKPFYDGMSHWIWIVTALYTALAAFFIHPQGLLLLAAVSIFAALFGFWLTKKLGGITGDVLGAANELSETIVLCGIYGGTLSW